MVPAGLGEAADAMVKLCVMRGLCLNIYVGIIIRVAASYVIKILRLNVGISIDTFEK